MRINRGQFHRESLFKRILILNRCCNNATSGRPVKQAQNAIECTREAMKQLASQYMVQEEHAKLLATQSEDETAHFAQERELSVILQCQQVHQALGHFPQHCYNCDSV